MSKNPSSIRETHEHKCSILSESVEPLQVRVYSLLATNNCDIYEKFENEYFSKLNSGKRNLSGAIIEEDRIVKQYGLKRKDITREYFTLKYEACVSTQPENLKFLDLPADLEYKMSHNNSGGGLKMRKQIPPRKLGTVSQNVNILEKHIFDPKAMRLKSQLTGLTTVQGNEYTDTILPLIQNLKLSKDKVPGRIKDNYDDVIGRQRSNIQDSDEEYYYLHLEEFFNNSKTSVRNDQEKVNTDNVSLQKSETLTFPEIKSNPTEYQSTANTESKKTVRNSAVGLFVSSVFNETASSQGEKSSFEKRLQYGKNLEQNWFKDHLSKTAERRDIPGNDLRLRMEMFYSPEPETEEDTENENTYPETLITPKTIDFEMDPSIPKISNRHISELRRHNSELFSSTDVLMGEDGEIERSSDSDIEIVLKNNELKQKRVKHKMRKKRRRKKERIDALLPNKSINQDQLYPALSDAEIRALRLKVKNRRPAPILKSKRKFLQIANVVFIFIHFRKILGKIRENRRKKRMKRFKKKRVTWKSENENDYVLYERTPRSPTLKDKFMQDIGWQLLDDMDKLPIPPSFYHGSRRCHTGYDEDGQEIWTPPLSLFILEVNEISLTDISEFPMRSPRICERRLSDSCLIKPSVFRLDSPVKSKKLRKREKSALKPAGKSRPKFKTKPRPESKTKSRPESHTKSRPESHTKSRTESRSPNAKKKKKKRQNSEYSKCEGNESGMSELEEACPKDKGINFDKTAITTRRRNSLDRNALLDGKIIELSELLHGIDMPTKEIRIQILKRKIRKQKLKKEKLQQIKNMEVALSTESNDNKSDGVVEIQDQEKSINKYTYTGYNKSGNDNIPRSPFVSAGVSWNHRNSAWTTRQRKQWTTEDVKRAVEKVSGLFMDLKNVRYLRLTALDQAIIDKLDEMKY